MYEERVYRKWSGRNSLTSFEVVYNQSDLRIQAGKNLEAEAVSSLLSIRRELQNWIARSPGFAKAMRPLEENPDAPGIIGKMISAGTNWEVGPMAAVAGAVAQEVGISLLRLTSEVIVENGGDIYAKCREPLRLSVYPGEDSPFLGRIIFEADAREGIGVCTSSAVVGPSLSLGKADAVTVLAPLASEADAAATAIANRIRSCRDVRPQVEWAAKRGGLLGVIACCADVLSVWGDLVLLEK